MPPLTPPQPPPHTHTHRQTQFDRCQLNKAPNEAQIKLNLNSHYPRKGKAAKGDFSCLLSAYNLITTNCLFICRQRVCICVCLYVCVCVPLQTCLENLFSCRLSSSVVSNLCSSIYQSISYEFLISGLAGSTARPLCRSPPSSLSRSLSRRLLLSLFRHQFDFLQFFQPAEKDKSFEFAAQQEDIE